MSELNGTLTALALDPAAGLHEPVHIRRFDHDIIGVETNYHGPRPSRLPPYLRHVVPSTLEFRLEALLRKDAQVALEGKSDVRAIDLLVRPSYAAQISEENGDFGKAVEALGRVSDARLVGVTFRSEPYQRDSLGRRMLSTAQRLAKRSDLRENVFRFRARVVDDATGKIDELNLLEDQLVSSQQIVTLSNRSRAIDPVAAFAAIGTAYESLKEDLFQAAGVSVRSDG